MHKKQNLDSLNAFCIDKARYMEHSNIPNFGLSGKNDFTLETIILFQNNSVKSDIYAQAGVFSFGIDQGQIYFEAPGFCSLKTSINQLHLNEQSIYSISLRYNKTDKKVSLFFQGYLIDEIETKPDGTEAAGNYQMGEGSGGSIGGIVSIHTFSKPLDEKQILKDSMRGTQEVPDSCVSWFDFQETNIADKSKNGLRVFVKGISTAFVKNYVPCSSFTGSGCAYTANVLSEEPTKYTICGKVLPKYSSRDMVIYSSQTETTGFTLFLQKQESFDYKLVCSYTGGQIISQEAAAIDKWLDFALTYDGKELILYVDGDISVQAEAAGISLKGGAGRYVGAEAGSGGRIIYNRGYIGDVSYIAEFARVLALKEVQGYVDNPPFIFDDAIASLITLDAPDAIESVYSGVINTTGNVDFIYDVATQGLSSNIGVEYFFPEEEDPKWKDLDQETQWKLRYFCDLCLAQLCGVVMGMDETEAAQFPSAETLSKNGASALIRAGMMELNSVKMDTYISENKEAIAVTVGTIAAIMTAIYLRMTSRTLAAIGRGYAPLTAGLTAAQAATIAANTEYSNIVIAALGAGVLAGGFTYLALTLLEDNEERPANLQSNIKINSLTINFNGDAAVSGVNCRKNKDTAIDPTVKNANNIIDYTGVIVPSVLKTTLKIRVNVTCETTAANKVVLTGKGGLGNFQSAQFNIAKDASQDIDISINIDSLAWKSQAIVQKLTGEIGWSFKAGEGSEVFIMNTGYTLYTLLDLPVKPWDAASQTYSSANTAYVWTDLLDICVQAYAHLSSDKTKEAHLSSFATDLNSCGKFIFDESGDSHFFISSGTIDASGYLAARTSAGNQPALVNSTDCAGMVALLGTACGIDTALLTLSAPRRASLAFNAVQYIGGTGWALPFGGSGLFHVVVVMADKLLSKDICVFDACFKIDSGSYPGINDGKHTKTATLALNYALAQTDSIKIDVPVSTPYASSFYRERLIADAAPCEFSVKGYLLDAE